MNGGTLQFTAANTTDYSPRIRLMDDTSSGIDTNSQAITFASPLAVGALGSGGINKVGDGTLTLKASNIYTGSTTVSGGTLILDYSSNTSKLADTSSLKLAGGTLNLAGGSHLEVVASTAITGAGTVNLTRSSGTSVIQLGDITRSSTGTLDIAANSIARTTLANDGSGKLPSWITVADQPAANDGAGNIITYSGFIDILRLGGVITNNPAANVRIVNGGTSGPVTLAAAGVTDISTLIQAATDGPATVSIGASRSLRLGASGLVSLASGAGTLTFNGGELTAGGAATTAGEITFANESNVIVNSVINDNGGEAVSIIKSGIGSLTLAADNYYTGGITLLEGRLNLNHEGALGSTSPLMIDGGSLDNTSGAALVLITSTPITWNADTTFVGSNDLNLGTGVMTLGDNCQITVTANTLTMGGALDGDHTLTKAGAGTLLLTSGSWSGLTTVAAGTLEVPAKAGDVPYVVASGATLKIGYTTGEVYAPTNLKLHGDGVAATTGLYLEGGESYNASGTIELLTAPTTIRQYGTGFTAIGTFDVNGTGMSCSAAASGSATDANVKFTSRGYGMSVDIASGANTATGDFTLNGPLDVDNAGNGFFKRGAGSLRLNAAATANNKAVRIHGGTIICGAAECLGAAAILQINSGSKLDVNGKHQTVTTLIFDGVTQAIGTWGSSTSDATNKDDTYFSGSGVVLVGAVAGYDTWKNQITDPLQQGRDMDPDGDGFTNLEEFLFGTSPIVADGSLTSLQRSGGDLIIRWKERAGGATYQLKESTNLSAWANSGAPVTDDGAVADDYQPKMATITIGAGKDFFRIEATEN